MQLGFGRGGHQSLQEFCHHSSWAPDLMFSSGFSQISNIFFCFLESARSAQLCSLKQQMCWCILHFLTEWKRSLFSSQRPVIGKPWPVCARSLPRYSQYGNCGQVVAGVSRGGDGKGDLEHLNWKYPRPLCLTQVLLESLWPFEMLAPCCMAEVCVPYPPVRWENQLALSFFPPWFLHRIKLSYLLSCVRGKSKSEWGLVWLAQNGIDFSLLPAGFADEMRNEQQSKALGSGLYLWVQVVQVAGKVGSLIS